MAMKCVEMIALLFFFIFYTLQVGPFRIFCSFYFQEIVKFLHGAFRISALNFVNFQRTVSWD